MFSQKYLFTRITRWLLFVTAILGVWALVLLVGGTSPIIGFNYLISGSVIGLHKLLPTLHRMVPLVLAALAVAVPGWTSTWNVGGEGQLVLGGVTAAVLGFSINSGFAPLNITIALVGAIFAGLLWALWPAILKASLGVNEVVTTLLASYIATSFVSFLISNPIKSQGSSIAETPYINETFRLPRLFSFSRFSPAFFITIFVAVILLYFRNKFKYGYEMVMTGSNEKFARLGGINVDKIRIVSMGLGGALAGLGGGLVVLGSTHRFMSGFSPEYGFTGLLICLLGRNNPLGIILIAFLFSALKTGSTNLELFSSVPAEVSGLMQVVLVLFASAFYKLVSAKRG